MNFFSKLFSRPTTILVVEDNENLLETTAALLEAEGFKALKAKNAKEGIELAPQRQPQLVLLDIQLPDMDGWQVLQILKNAQKTKTIAVVMLTSLNQMGDVSQAFQLGADGYLPKPANAASLYKKVREILAKR